MQVAVSPSVPPSAREASERVLNGVSNAILRALGVDPNAEFDEAGTPEDFKLLIGQSRAGGKLAPSEAEMLTGVFHLHEQQVRHVMTPGPAVVTVDVSDSVHSAADLCARSGHTRLVVIEDGNRDHVRGILHASDVIRGLRDPSGGTRLESLVREAPVVPETMALDIVLAALRARRSSMAVVVDEYGGTAGVVTVEDLLEEIVGDIADETDSSADGIRRTSDDAWQIDGYVPINDLADHGVQLPVDSGAVNSVGGLVLAKIGRLPRPGDSVRLGEYLATVAAVHGHRIESVRLRRAPRAET